MPKEFEFQVSGQLSEEGLKTLRDKLAGSDSLTDDGIARSAALEFLDRVGLVPTQEAIDQLVDAFLPCLAIICSRGYSPDGANWRKMGFRGLLMEIHTRWERIHYNCWQRGQMDKNNPTDAINYLGYFIRMQNRYVPVNWGEEWGSIGKPGGSDGTT